MQSLNNGNPTVQRSFTDCLQQLRSNHDIDTVTTIPNIKEWMHYWNDEESYAANLRNIRHWMTRIQRSNGYNNG